MLLAWYVFSYTVIPVCTRPDLISCFGKNKLSCQHYYLHMILQSMYIKAKQQSYDKKKEQVIIFFLLVVCLKSVQYTIQDRSKESITNSFKACKFSNVAATCESKRSSLLFHIIFISNNSKQTFLLGETPMLRYVKLWESTQMQSQ